MADLFVARQPIFDRQLKVAGYELLYRPYQVEQSHILDGDQATSQVILNTFSQIGLSDLVGDNQAFINFTRNFLVGAYPIPFPPEHVVLEVLEDVHVDQDLLCSLQGLAQQGYSIALDDIASFEHAAPLLPIAKLVKVDLQQADRLQLPELVSRLRSARRQLLAEKVETQQDFEYSKLLGFDLFQGYFLCRPNLVKSRRMDASRLVILQLLSRITDPSVDFGELERIIAQDIHLSYKLLKLVNSAAFFRTATIKSIREAIAMIGLNQLRGWMALLLMSTVQDKPHELTMIAVQRAKMCELLGRLWGSAHVETFFLVGLLSILDALMDLPLPDALASLPLSAEVKAALLDRQGLMGAALRVVLEYERGNWDFVLRLGVNPESVRNSYLQAIAWSNQLSSAMAGMDPTAP